MNNSKNIVEFKVVPYSNNRFCIVDDNGEIIDNAQGYGYKTKQNAYKAGYWKFKGGKENKLNEDNKSKNFIKDLLNRKRFDLNRIYIGYMEGYFKDLLIDNMQISNIFGMIEKEIGEDIPTHVKQYLQNS